MKKVFLVCGLLLSFLALVITGLLAFFTPFSLTVARVHITFAIVLIICVSYHFFQEKRFYSSKIINRFSQADKRVYSALLVAAILFMIAYQNLQPVKGVIESSYESQRYREIVRSAPSVFNNLEHQTLDLLKQVEACHTSAPHLAMQLEMRSEKDSFANSAIAIWIESTTGSLIETLYLTPELAYSDNPVYQGIKTQRHKILPIWRHKYTLKSGLQPDGELDMFTGATENHKFGLGEHIKSGNDEYLVFVEINTLGDTNVDHTDTVIGQPSLLYSGFVINGDAKQYVVLELTGHSGGMESSGHVNYRLETIGTAKELIDLLLLSVFPCIVTVDK